MNQASKINIVYIIIAALVFGIAYVTAQKIMIAQEQIIDQQNMIIQQNIILQTRISSGQNAGRISANQQKEATAALYNMKSDIFRSMPKDNKSIVFLGDSITDSAPFSELFDSRVKNRGIGGDTTEGVLKRLDEIISIKPAKLFILIGINDLNLRRSTQTIIRNIRTIVSGVQKDSPDTKIYLQSLLPVNRKKFRAGIPSASIENLNAEIKKAADEMHCVFVDLYPLMLDESKTELDLKYTLDGIHLNGAGIVKWAEFLKSYVNE